MSTNWRDILSNGIGVVTQSHMSIAALDDDDAIVYLVSLDKPIDPRRLQHIGVLARTPDRVDAYLEECGVSLDGWSRAM